MKKGFTLIELLAVIAILAILVIIAVPTVLGLFNNAKLNAFKVETQSILKAAEQGYATSLIKNGTVNETIYTYDEDGELTIEEGNIDIYLSGKKIKNGQIKILSSGEIELLIYNGEFCASKTIDSKEITVERKLQIDCKIFNETAESCFSFDNGIITDYNYLDENCPSDVVIPDTIGDQQVLGIGNYAFAWNDITSVYLPDAITTIGDYAFVDNLITYVHFSKNLTTIGFYAFGGNTLLSSINLPNSLITIEGYGFVDNNLMSLTIPNNVQMIGDYAFSDNQISTLIIPNKVKEMVILHLPGIYSNTFI